MSGLDLSTEQEVHSAKVMQYAVSVHDVCACVPLNIYHKYGSTYSRTEPENAKTGGQDLSPSARWPRTEFLYMFI